MSEEEPEPGDWRSVGTRAHDHASLDRAHQRAHQPDRGRDANSPAQIPVLGWKDILVRVFWAMPQDRVLATAGGVAFFGLLAVFPGIATVVSVYGLFSDPKVIAEHLNILSGILPVGVLDLLGSQMTTIAGKSTGTLSTASVLSLLIAFWSTNSGVSALFDALNVIYKEREKRTIVVFYATTVTATLAIIIFTLTATVLVVGLPIALAHLGLGSVADTVIRIARWPALLGVVGLGLSLIYRYGPSRREAKWRWVTWGAGAAALLWVAASALFSWYVASFDSYNRTYGSLGAGVGFMTWIWLSIVIVLLGAELDSEMERQTASDSTEGRPKALGKRDAYVADTVGPASSP